MVQVLAAGTPARLLEAKDASHGFANTSPESLADTYELYGIQEQLLWFREYLAG
jgi:hypothetical protein